MLFHLGIELILSVFAIALKANIRVPLKNCLLRLDFKYLVYGYTRLDFMARSCNAGQSTVFLPNLCTQWSIVLLLKENTYFDKCSLKNAPVQLQVH